jgi:hypothetical protein
VRETRIGAYANRLPAGCERFEVDGSVRRSSQPICASPLSPSPAVDRILLLRLGAIGDVARTLPAASALRAAYPGAHIAWLVEPASLDLRSEERPHEVRGVDHSRVDQREHHRVGDQRTKLLHQVERQRRPAETRLVIESHVRIETDGVRRHGAVACEHAVSE